MNNKTRLQRAAKIHGLDELTVKRVALERFFELPWRERNSAIIRYWKKQKQKQKNSRMN